MIFMKVGYCQSKVNLSLDHSRLNAQLSIDVRLFFKDASILVLLSASTMVEGYRALVCRGK